MEEAKKSVGSI